MVRQLYRMLQGVSLLLSLLVCASSFGATYYVDRNNSSASDTNAGTAAAPWRTIQKAAQTAGTGDTVIVKSGTYAERITLSRSGALGQEITFRADPPRSVSMRGFTLSGNYLRVEGFKVENTTEIGFRIRGNHLAIINNAIMNIPKAAIMGDPVGDYPNWCTDVYVADNYCEHVNFGIVAVGFDWVIERNEVRRVYNEGIGGDADYSRFFGSDITFRYNYFHGTSLQDISGQNGTWDGGGSSDDAHLDGWQSFINRKPYGTTFSNITFEGNILRNFSQALHWEAIDNGSRYRNVRFVNNVVMPERGTERDSRVGINVYEVTGFTIENNTFIGMSGQAVSVRDSDQVSIRNNIFYKCAWAYAWNDSTTNASDGPNIIFQTKIPYNISPSGVLNVDPDLIDPTRIPNDWLEAFAPDAGWRVANTRWADMGAQIPPFANKHILEAHDDSKLYVDINSRDNKLNVLGNDYGYRIRITSFDASSVLGSLTLDAKGNLKYTPPEDFRGKENFTYTVEDYVGDTATANAQIRVVNLPLSPWTAAILVVLLGSGLAYTIRRGDATNAKQG